MPTNTLDAQLAIAGSATLATADRPNSTAEAAVRIGGGGFPALAAAFTDGVGDQQANELYCDRVTVPAGADLDLDLAGGLTNGLGQTVTLTAVKAVVVAIVSPDGTKAVRVGPQGATHAFPGWFGGVAAANYETVTEAVARWDSFAGWPVGAGATDVLRLHNPGGADVDVDVLIIGTK